MPTTAQLCLSSSVFTVLAARRILDDVGLILDERGRHVCALVACLAAVVLPSGQYTPPRLSTAGNNLRKLWTPL